MAEMCKPATLECTRDRDQIVAVFQGKIGAFTVLGCTAEPLREETLLCLALIREVAAEQWAQFRIGLDAVVQPVNQRADCRVPADARKQIAAYKRPKGFVMTQEAAVLHAPDYST
jgi:hypothetical protein